MLLRFRIPAVFTFVDFVAKYSKKSPNAAKIIAAYRYESTGKTSGSNKLLKLSQIYRLLIELNEMTAMYVSRKGLFEIVTLWITSS